ncbi:hypothetical protein SODALDRAFT_134440 [Sodiomyces alkalinus F11]|uniref:Autophagy-related protein 14 n=1 Tax=Sodiomyces alkalinus (strain CBS 110278 / VKM F-3762 / F11) TaxID=1314773 RepID=A0A3N2PZ49_SODAK|nr:hypothetical protein SODALDRAFT_134440 [Sodiomyces alkalinus F11]ROT39625.1 hypothetical protein SODALDRAFT_134440 [Sodiomyces alkalinus F11]
MPSEPRTTPLLLPQNRRLRHLQGIFLRHLSFVPSRGRTADDSDASLTASPTKKKLLDALGDGPKLQHSQSTESLRPMARRRSTTTAWHQDKESPESEQKKLEAFFDSKMADAFFSLHAEGEEEPIYISETLERRSNFNFLFFDLSHHGGVVTRASTLTVKVWARRPVGHQDWFLHQEAIVDLRSLNFLGTLAGQRLPPNALIFHLHDGVYSLDLPGKSPRPREGPTLLTSSYNSLMKLATLDASIQDALATQEQVTAQINDILEKQPKDEAPMAQEKVKLGHKYIAQVTRSLKAARRKRDELQASLQARREAIAAGREAQTKAETDISNAREKLADAKALLAATQQQIRGQRRRICGDLSSIFPITPSPSGAVLSFDICGLPLPNTTYDSASSRPADDDRISAALGYVALLTHHLQFYLSVPLPYPIVPYGSRSNIRDDISLLADTPRSSKSSTSTSSTSATSSIASSYAATRRPLLPPGTYPYPYSYPSSASSSSSSSSSAGSNHPARDFPLYLPRGGSTAAHFRFDYAWFLLNKDVESLCASQALRVVDIRHTLPNLKYLLYICSAGSDEVPQRKRGGVRGLWAGRLHGRLPLPDPVRDDDPSVDGSSSAGASRRGSPNGETGGRGPGRGGGTTVSASGAEADSGVAGFGFDEADMKVSLRTKGFRENVGG